MEKFGIFDLLDTLSALAEQEGDASAPMTEEPSPPPPVYAAREDAPVNRGALNGFLSRHDAISRKIDGMKKD